MKKSELQCIIKEELKKFKNSNRNKNILAESANNWRNSGEKLLATNKSIYGWEYHYHIETAYLFVNPYKLALRMVVEHYTKNVGINRFEETSSDSYALGNINKPKLGQVRSILKKFSVPRSRAGVPFKIKWVDAKTGNSDSLTNILNKIKQK